MKIAMFTNTYKPHVGGVAKSVHALAQTLREMGHSVMVVAPTFPDAKMDFSPDSEVVRVPALQNFNGSDFSVRLPAPFALTSVLDEFQPELIHSHHPFLLGDTAIRMARRYNIPLIFTHHTRYEHYTHYVSLESDAMRTFASQLAVEYANLCDGVVVPSESMQELLLDRGIKVPMSVVPTGVDLQMFAQHDTSAWRKQLQLPDEVQLIGHVGRLAEEKNLEYLGHCVALVLEQYPDTHFAIAGDGTYKKQLSNYFDAKNLADRVSFCGVLQGQELVDFYASLDLFLFASVSETQGMVLAEAMAAGTPVVALDAPGAREVVNDQNGCLLRANSSEKEFADSVIEELKQLKKNSTRQKMARETAQFFSQTNCAERMLAFYRQCMDQFPHEHNDVMPEALEPIINAIKTEWELVGQKAEALVRTLNK